MKKNFLERERTLSKNPLPPTGTGEDLGLGKGEAEKEFQNGTHFKEGLLKKPSRQDRRGAYSICGGEDQEKVALKGRISYSSKPSCFRFREVRRISLVTFKKILFQGRR